MGETALAGTFAHDAERLPCLPICEKVYPTDANFFLAKMTDAQPYTTISWKKASSCATAPA